MRVAFVGAGEMARRAAEILVSRGHDVVVVEQDRELIDELADELDCGFVHGDGSNPAILKEVGPEDTEVLFCLAGADQDNLIAALVGRSLGFSRVVPSISDPEYESICLELGLDDTIFPTRTISRHLADMVGGGESAEMSTAIRGDARLFVFQAREREAGPLDDLELPSGSKVICLYRGEELVLAGPDTELAPGDEVVVLARSRALEELRSRWQPDLQEAGREKE
jgi:trk system potassium uptake protein TrkA